VECEERRCSLCGWNPQVAEARISRLEPDELLATKQKLRAALEALAKLRSRRYGR